MESSGGDRGASARSGQHIAHYELLGELGRGGAGIVYRARDLSLDRQVALKCVRPDRGLDAASRHRLLREARAASRLSHPNIVTIFEVFENQGIPWVVFELVEGLSLRATLEQRGPLPISEILHDAEGLAEGLRAAHAAGVLHRDISPNNILIARDGRILLTDFGLARLEAPAERISEATTRSVSSDEGSFIGTPGYMSPETLLGRKLDARSDLFSLGAVLYEMCAGLPPFPHSSLGELTDAILHRAPAPIRRRDEAVPEELERIVRKAMAKRPEERYQEAREMLADLRALKRRRDSGDSEYVPRPPRRWWVAAWAGLAAAVLLGGGFAWLRLGAATEAQPLPSAIPRQLTAGAGWEGDPALSQDGEFVAYAAQAGTTSDLWIIDVHGGQPLRLTDDPATDRSPAWFPDGSAVAFVSDRNGIDSIWKVPRLGGSAVLLIPDAVDPAIAPEGGRVAFARINAAGVQSIHVATLADSSTDRTLTDKADGVGAQGHPAWSPDGRMLCYDDEYDLWLVPSAGGKARRLTADHGSDHAPAWSGDGRSIYFSSWREGTQALWRIDLGGGKIERVTLGTGPEGQPSIARRSGRLAYSTLVERRGIAILDRRTGASTRQSTMWEEAAPAFGPDARALYFTSNRQGHFDLWAQPLMEGHPEGEPRRLTDQAGSVGTIAVSPDGRFVAYHRVLAGQRDIWIVPARGGLPVNVTGDPAVDVQPAWSPDGRRLAFVSDRDGGFHLWLVEVEEGRVSGPPVRITSGASGDYLPAWSADGRYLAFVRYADKTADVWIVQAEAGGAPRRLTRDADARFVRWEPRSGALLVSGVWGTPETRLRWVDPAGGETHDFSPPVRFGNALALGEFAVSADGRLLATVEEERRGNIWILEATSGSY
jgi:Tol biopolymer transport system component